MILIYFVLLNMANAITWISFAPVSDKAEDFWNTNSFWVNNLSLSFAAVYIPLGFLAAWVVDHKGLQLGVMLASLATAAGAWIRVTGKWGYWYALIGQTLCGCAQPIILSAPPKIASNWFPDDQRTLATTLASVANPIGIAIGFLLPPIFTKTADDLPKMMFYEAIIVAGMCLPSLLLFREKPPSVPSAAADAERTDSFWHSIKLLFTDWNFLNLLSAFSMGQGAYNTLATVVNQVLEPFGYSNSDAGLLGALVIGCGLVGALLGGPVIDKTRRYKVALLIGYFFATASMLVGSFELRANNLLGMGLCVGVLGFTFTPALPISFELGCEVTYPVGEATPTGMLLIVSQITSIACVLVVDQWFLNGDESNRNGMRFLAACFAVGFLLTCFFRTKLKRKEHEERHKQSNTVNASQ